MFCASKGEAAVKAESIKADGRKGGGGASEGSNSIHDEMEVIPESSQLDYIPCLNSGFFPDKSCRRIRVSMRMSHKYRGYFVFLFLVLFRVWK